MVGIRLLTAEFADLVQSAIAERASMANKAGATGLFVTAIYLNALALIGRYLA